MFLSRPPLPPLPVPCEHIAESSRSSPSTIGRLRRPFTSSKHVAREEPSLRTKCHTALPLLWRILVRHNLQQVFVGEGSTARFMNDFSTEDVGVRSVPDGDFASYQLSGGYVCFQTTHPLVGSGNAVYLYERGGGRDAMLPKYVSSGASETLCNHNLWGASSTTSKIDAHVRSRFRWLLPAG